MRDSFGESHSLVVHKLWVLDVGGSNPPSPTNLSRPREIRRSRDRGAPMVDRRSAGSLGDSGTGGGPVSLLQGRITLKRAFIARARTAMSSMACVTTSAP